MRSEAVTRSIFRPGIVFWLLFALLASAPGWPQPDPRQMSGIPRPDGQQAPRSVSVRVIRGAMTNNVANQPVELFVSGKAQTVNTGPDGRAQFENLTPGATLKAATVVDGERLESQEFPAPGAGEPGIRLLLVASGGAAASNVPAIAGELTIGGRSRIVIEPDEESIRVYYLLEILNNQSAPVNPSSVFMFDVPKEAQATAIMEGSPKEATASDNTIRVQGPFPPGQTFIQVGYALPAPNGSVQITQAFPATLDHLPVMVKKLGGTTTLSSPNIDRQQEMPLEGDNYIVGVGDRQIPAKQAITLTVGGLPHHSSTPRYIALVLAVALVLVGAWAAWRPGDRKDRAEVRKELIARREKLFQELIRLEADARKGKGDPARYAARRADLVAALEHVYGALDTDDAGPEPADRAGRAA
jgi:hypothetical protein